MILDIVLLVVLVFYAIYGWRKGLLTSLGSIAGMVAGGALGYWLLPIIAPSITDSVYRVLASVGILLVLIIVGQLIGSAMGRAIRPRKPSGILKSIDAIFGAFFNVIVVAMVISLLAVAARGLAVASVDKAVDSSRVVTTLNKMMPQELHNLIAQAHGAIIKEGIPRALPNLSPLPQQTVPEQETVEGNEITQASQSVARISGIAAACSQSQTGSGFVAGSELVMTNAHVVAGLTDPLVQIKDGITQPGTVIHFDESRDIAIIRVPGLSSTPLTIDTAATQGTIGAIAGFPGGGPFQLAPAVIDGEINGQIPDIYGQDQGIRPVMTLSANVQQGNSGGPFITDKGDVAAMVFAKSRDTENIGYAVVPEDLTTALNAADTSTQEVTTGHCTKE